MEDDIQIARIVAEIERSRERDMEDYCNEMYKPPDDWSLFSVNIGQWKERVTHG